MGRTYRGRALEDFKKGKRAGHRKKRRRCSSAYARARRLAKLNAEQQHERDN